MILQQQLFRRNCNSDPFVIDSLEEDMKKFSLIAILVAFLIGLAGCNTVKGVGKDVAALGNGVDQQQKSPTRCNQRPICSFTESSDRA